MKLMKKLTATALSLAIALSLLPTAIQAAPGTPDDQAVHTRSKRTKDVLEVTYAKGKAVPILGLEGSRNVAGIKRCKKTWGKATKTIYDDQMDVYIWKKGKTRIQLSSTKGGRLCGIMMTMKDKNGAMAGIRVGMSEKQVIKDLKDMYGPQGIEISNRSIEVRSSDVSYEIVSGKISRIRKAPGTRVPAGVKKGMTEKEAVSRLKKAYGSNRVSVYNKMITLRDFGLFSFSINSSGKVVKIEGSLA